MKLTTTIVFCLFYISLFSQIRFEEAYFIDKNDQRVECLIKNEDWNFNPRAFEYKLTEESETKVIDVFEVKEFGIGKNLRYLGKTVSIDQSSDQVEFLSTKRNPEWLQQTVFLKVIVEGKYCLYEYRSSSAKKYFYRVSGGEISQLIFKTYKTNDFNVRDNNQYHQQLINIFQGTSINPARISSATYKLAALSQFFVQANKDTGAEFVLYKIRRKTLLVHLKGKAGNCNIDFKNNFDLNADFGNIPTYGIGAEIEFVLPVNNNRWSIFLEPYYRTMQAEEQFMEANSFFDEYVGKVSYSSIEIPIGIKYNINVSKNFALYATIFGMTEAQLGEAIFINQLSGERILGNYGAPNNIGAGIGMRLFKRVMIEGKYYGQLSTIDPFESGIVPLPYFSLNAGVTLFSL